MDWGVKIMVTLHDLCDCSTTIRSLPDTIISTSWPTPVIKRLQSFYDTMLSPMLNCRMGSGWTMKKFGVHMGFQSYWKSRDYWEFFEKKERTPFMGAEFPFSSDAGFIFWIQISLGKLFSLINSWALENEWNRVKSDDAKFFESTRNTDGTIW